MNWHDTLSLIISFLSLFGFGAIMKHFWDDRHAKKLADSEEKQKQRKEQRQSEIREVIKAELTPINSGINLINEQLEKNTIGTVTLLRDQMKQILDACKRQGWASSSDKANYNELYNTYSQLGGNHFKDYVDEWKEEMKCLPTREDLKKGKSQSDEQ